jgi:hypothetical protein
MDQRLTVEVLAERIETVRAQMAGTRELVAAELRGQKELTGVHQEAVLSAKHDVNARLLEMNNLRDQITTERADFVTRNEWSTNHGALLEKLDAFVKASDERFRAIERLVYMGVGAAIIINAVVGIVVTFIVYFMKKA